MNDLKPKKYALKAALCLSAGAVFAIVAAIGMSLDPTRKMAWLWILLFVATLPAFGWGSSHLARHRGYPSGAGCGLCIVAYLMSGFLGTTSPHPLALGIGVLFIVLLPTGVLLALPNKSGRSRRSNRRR